MISVSAPVNSSTMSAMTQANMSNPSGNCRATRRASACLIFHTVLCISKL